MPKPYYHDERVRSPQSHVWEHLYTNIVLKPKSKRRERRYGREARGRRGSERRARPRPIQMVRVHARCFDATENYGHERDFHPGRRALKLDKPVPFVHEVTEQGGTAS